MSVRAINALQMPPQDAQERLSTIAAGLRPDDRNEVLASSGGDLKGILRQSLALSSSAWFIEDREGTTIAVFGVAPGAAPGVGVVWMLGTEGVEREWVGVARQTQRYLDEMHQHYHLLWNYIDARNELSQKWLLWSGFHLIDADPAYGVEGRLFYEFAPRRLGGICAIPLPWRR